MDIHDGYLSHFYGKNIKEFGPREGTNSHGVI